MGWVSEQMTVKYRVIRVTLILLLAIANIFEICVIISGDGRGCFSRAYSYYIDYCDVVDSSVNFMA